MSGNWLLSSYSCIRFNSDSSWCDVNQIYLRRIHLRYFILYLRHILSIHNTAVFSSETICYKKHWILVDKGSLGVVIKLKWEHQGKILSYIWSKIIKFMQKKHKSKCHENNDDMVKQLVRNIWLLWDFHLTDIELTPYA